jgi:RNA polymerase sigma-70 factor (ECF subfamily)
MEALHSHAGGEQNSVALMRELASGELQDAVSRYLPAFYRRAFRYVGDPHDAEDAVQDALLSAYKHLDQFKRTAKMSTWLTAIVTNSALAQLRKRPRHSHVSLNEQLNDEQDSSLSDKLADTRPSPEDEYAGSESHGFLMQRFSKLSPSLQQAFRLRYMDGLTTAEAAQLLKISTATMKSRVWRARTYLKRMMSELQLGEEQ